MKNVIIGLLLTSLTACNDNSRSSLPQNSDTDSDTAVAKAMIPRATCYENITAKDTVKLKVEVFPNVVTGTISYFLFEKDKNEGEFDGKLRGDTLIGDYTFMSEGVRSTRQVAFLIKDNLAIEGYGALEEKDGKMVFKDLTQLKFEGRPLRTVPCHTDQPVAVNSAGSEVLFQYQWNLTELQGKPVNSQRFKQKPHLLFYPGQISRVAGSTGCNRLSGTFELSENKAIKFSPIVTTRMACPGSDNIEPQFLDGLSKATRWRVIDNELSFYSGSSLVAKLKGAAPDTAAATAKNAEPERDQASAAFHKKFLAGIDFMATGNEPFWWLEIDDRKDTRFGVIGGDTVQAPTLEAKLLKDAVATNYKLQTKSGLLDVTIYNRPCINDMSGENLPKTVKVTWDNQTYNGCGRLLAAYAN